MKVLENYDLTLDASDFASIRDTIINAAHYDPKVDPSLLLLELSKLLRIKAAW